MPSISGSSMGARFTTSSVMNKTDCLVGIESIQKRLGVAANEAIPKAVAKALPQSKELLLAIAESQPAREALGIDDAKRDEILTRADRLAPRDAVIMGGHKMKKSRKKKKTPKPKKKKKKKKS